MKLKDLIDKMLEGKPLPEVVVFKCVTFKLFEGKDYRCVYGFSLLDMVNENTKYQPVNEMVVDLVYEV